MSTLKVQGIRHTSASSDAITLATDGTCTAKITNRSSNLIINGSMICAQRGTSSTGHGMEVVDRWNHYRENVDENPTFAQVDVASGTTPYQKGFRKSFKITNGNQTSGAGGDDYITIDHKIEAQDIANSGWDYTSASSYITLSFWVKSSVAQTFYGYLRSQDGTSKLYPFETGSLTADTWTKVTKTIPGVSGLQFDNDNGHGLQLRLLMFRGTNKTGSTTLDQWQAWNNTVRTPDNTSTWYTTNDATFEITGVQLEVGDVATDFEHRSYGDELARCMRYFQRDGGGQYTGYGMGVITSNAGGIWTMPLPVPMRAAPTITNDGNVRLYDGSTNANVTAWNTNRSTVKNFWIEPQTASSSFTVGRAFLVGNNDTTDGYLNLSAEL